MPPSSPTGRSPGWPLALLAFGSLITALDFTIVYVALPEMARGVGFSAHALQWVVSAYAIAYGGFLLLGGRLADVAGRRRMFVVGMLLFGGASLLGGLAGGPEQLIAARVLQGIGAAIVSPATLSLVSTTFAEGRERNRAMTVWASAGAAGLSLGALLGGVLTEAVGWQGVYFVNVPLVAIAAAAAFALLPPDGPRERDRPLDLPGALTGTAGATLLVLAIAQAPEQGAGSAPVVVAALLAVALLALFVAVEARSPSPLMPLRLLRDRGLTAALAVIFAFGLTLQGIPYFLTLYFQDVLGFSALEGGVAFLGPTLAITAGNLLADRLVACFGTRVTLIAGMVVGLGGGLLLAAQMSADASYATVLAGILVTGLAMGLIFPPMFIAATSGVDAAEQGTASGMASTALQAGAGAGLAILVGIATDGLGGLGGEALRVATADNLATTMRVIAVGALLGVVAALLLPRQAGAPAPAPTPAAEEPAGA
ncbi:MFS transporter [Conexibacter arvalis]|uniref:EmrB/QacA subfamily drug resistance transporter n=1 Tax=Conexibacter arvalis TaxID=912552 RepID=A0A840I721_9ACTN|nr:MFS transporter [Conexibacter arvalis]MBB4660706.1 EmrB/QacA subfamily drug resistance transporter [Conexibacter arvalis]